MSHTSSLSGRVIDYLGGLRVTQGAGIGQPLDLYPWERRFIRGALA